MPHKNGQNEMVDVEALLRSIHVRMDATEPARLAHFRPTSKSVPLLNGLLGRDNARAWLIEAPYGTGKSLATAYLLHLVENRSESRNMLATVEPRLRKADSSLGQYAARRTRDGKQGLALVLEGYEPDLPAALKRATLESMDRLKLGRQARPLRQRSCSNLDEAVAFLQAAEGKAADAGLDHLSIIWDEFGRHLQSLISEGRANSLADVQTLAEYTDRSARIPVTLGLLLHQNLLQYADRASQAVRSEWVKIEGRFATHQYIDDSREMYRLLAEAIAGRRPSSLTLPTKKAIEQTARQARELGYFSDWSLPDLVNLFTRAYPIEPAALALLPRLSARVGQSERTLFAFIHDADLNEPVGPEELYDYFSPAMRADTAVGGTYRRWLETESALSKADSIDWSSRALKTACLLGIGVSGERTRASFEAVTFATAGYSDTDQARSCLNRLIEGKLLLHRAHSDQVSVWHGTDIDLRGQLEDLKARERESFDLGEFLTREAPPPIWKPVAYNDQFDVRRFLRGQFLYRADLGAELELGQQVAPLQPDEDGRVLYLVPDDHDTLDLAVEEITKRLEHERLIVAVPQEPVPVSEAALEVQCLRTLRQDPYLLGEDPLAGAEIDQLLDDAKAHLQRLLDRITQPGPSGPRWYYRGKEVEVASAWALRHVLSQIMRKVYPQTPRIRNEMINRHRPSRILVNARKKMMLGILERAGKPQLGIQGHTPDASIYRTVMERTGLYREYRDGDWRFAQPKELHDPGLKAIWQRLQSFWTEPADQPKAPATLFDELVAPPYGLRRGLLPLLFAASYQAFPAASAITCEGEYLNDVLPSHIEDIVRQPTRYRVKVLTLTADRHAYLKGVYELFAEQSADSLETGDLIRATHDAFESWRVELPRAAVTSREIDERARGLQAHLGSPAEPVHLLFEELPRAAGHDGPTPDVLTGLRAAKSVLEQITSRYVEQAAQTVIKVINIDVVEEAGALPVARKWAESFPNGVLNHLADSKLRGLVSRMATPYRSDRQLIDSLAQLLVGKPIKQWDDISMGAFQRELDGAVRHVEEIALSSGLTGHEVGDPNGRLASLAKKRFAQWHTRYRELVGEDAALESLRELEVEIADKRRPQKAEGV